jgi:hypothetical protein
MYNSNVAVVRNVCLAFGLVTITNEQFELDKFNFVLRYIINTAINSVLIISLYVGVSRHGDSTDVWCVI